MSDRKRRIATPLLLLAGLVGGLVLAGLVLVVADPPPSHRATAKDKTLEIAEPESLRRQVGWTNARSRKKVFRYDGDPRGYFGPGARVTHTTNSLGFPGPELSRTKAEGVLRVATLDLLPELTGYSGTDLRVHPTDQHPDEVVHELAAALLAERVLASLAPDTAASEARGEG